MLVDAPAGVVVAIIVVAAMAATVAAATERFISWCSTSGAGIVSLTSHRRVTFRTFRAESVLVRDNFPAWPGISVRCGRGMFGMLPVLVGRSNDNDGVGRLVTIRCSIDARRIIAFR